MTPWEILFYIWAIVAPVVVFSFLFVFYVFIVYGHHIERIFATKPLLMAPKVPPEPADEDVRFTTESGRQLVGSLWRHRGEAYRGRILFLHEYGANRHLFKNYVGFLRSEGFDIFAFDFCNEGESDSVPGYTSIQWVTRYEVDDTLAALRFLENRADADPKGVFVFGVSKGGGAGIGAAAKSRFVRGVITDGAFPTHSMVTDYAMLWCQIYVRLGPLWRLLPRRFFVGVVTMSLWRMSRKRGIEYSPLERLIAKIAPRPILMIYGERDAYIKPAIAKRFFGRALEPKEVWFVPGAKHNCCVEANETAYRNRVRDFLNRQLNSQEKRPSPPQAVGS